MTITVGVNSFITEAEFYSHLSTRLNADEFTYLAAVYEAGATWPEVAHVFNDMRGLSLVEIEAALVDSQITPEQIAQIYNLLSSSKTTVQTKNAQALILATELINQFEFIGKPTDTAQLLQWPRIGAIDRNRQAIPETTIPAGIKKATAELALILLRYDITDPQQHHHLFLLTSERVGEAQSSYGKAAVKKLPDVVMDTLKPYLLEKSAFSAELLP